jgi:hypothetical protein
MLSARKIASSLIFAAAGAIAVSATDISIPNYSFEQPVVPDGVPAYPVHVAWTQTPKRPDYVEVPPFTWNVLTGVFPNQPAGSADRIENMDGNQAAYLFAETENGIYQELPAKFEAGFSYRFTVGLTGSPNSPLTEGSSLDLTFYYRDAGGAIVPVFTRMVNYHAATMGGGTNLVDFSVQIPATATASAALGKSIGVLIKSTALENKGGVWDIDNARLAATREYFDVPNFSFENPPVPPGAPASPVLDAWQKFSKPAYWDEAAFGAWDNIIGAFPNQPADQQGYIPNMNGAQAAYLFNTPGSGIFQDLALNYDIDAAYTLTVGVAGSVFRPLPPNSPLAVEFYYRDAQNTIVPIMAKTVFYTPQNFPTTTNFYDFSVTTPPVFANAPWANQPIGIRIYSAVGFDAADGVWDVDNVRLTLAFGVKLLVSLEDNQVRITWSGDANHTYQLMRTEDFITWTPLALTPGVDGDMQTVVSTSDFAHAFYTVRASP